MPRRTALAAAAVLPAVLLLAACSGLPDLTAHQRQGTAPTAAALELAWSTPASQPDWVPADASRIRWIASTTGGADAAPAAVRVRSDADLPAACTPLQQEAGAAIRASWAPDAVPADVRRCGNWAVARVGDGYYGWTPVEAPAEG